MAKKAQTSIEDRLRTLFDLQLIDSRIHQLENYRGELPLEVKFFEDEIEGLKTRIQKYKDDIDRLNEAIQEYKDKKAQAEKQITRYKEMQANARNDREFKTLQEEIDFYESEILLAEKRTKEALVQIAQDEQEIREVEEVLEKKQKQFEEKKKELDEIISETQKEEEELKKLREEYRAKLPERLLKAYDRLINKFKNRIGVISYDGDVAGASYFVIPPQVKLEIRERDRIIVDEHTGRILVDPELAEEERQKMQEIFNKFSSVI